MVNKTPCKHILHMIQQHMADSNMIMSTTLFSVGKIRFGTYFQTITNEVGSYMFLCPDACTQPYPLVVLLRLYMNPVNLYCNTFVAYLEGSENKKSRNFCKTEATLVSKKAMRQQEGLKGPETCSRGFLIQLWVLFFDFFFV